MKLPKSVRKNLLVVLVTSLLLVHGVSAALNPRGQASDEQVGGLQIAVFPDPDESGHGKAPKFRVELLNVGEDDMILDLGSMIGKKQDPENIALTLFDARGRSLHLVDFTQPMNVDGRVDPMFLPLPAGSRFSIAVDLARYWPPVTVDEFEKPLAPGTYWLQAQLTVKSDSQQRVEREFGCPGMICWSGSITSNRLRFEIPTQ
jgi:hypothetical protein